VQGGKQLLDLLEGLLERLARLEPLLDRDYLGHAIYHFLHQLHLRETEALLVRDVPLATNGLRVLARGPARLKVELGADLLELVRARLVEERDLDHHGCAKPGTKVGGAGAKKAEAVRVHEVRTILLGRRLDCVGDLAEPGKHLLHVPALLHGDDAAVVLLVGPGQSGLGIIVEDAASLRPVACSAGSAEQLSRAGLLKQETVGLEGVLLLLAHTAKTVIGALEFTREHGEGLCQHPFNAKAILLRHSETSVP